MIECHVSFLFRRLLAPAGCYQQQLIDICYFRTVYSMIPFASEQSSALYHVTKSYHLPLRCAAAWSPLQALMTLCPLLAFRLRSKIPAAEPLFVAITKEDLTCYHRVLAMISAACTSSVHANMGLCGGIQGVLYGNRAFRFQWHWNGKLKQV